MFVFDVVLHWIDTHAISTFRCIALAFQTYAATYLLFSGLGYKLSQVVLEHAVWPERTRTQAPLSETMILSSA